MTFSVNYAPIYFFNLQKENGVHKVDQFHINEILKDSVTKQNSFAQFLLVEVIANYIYNIVAKNFLLFDHIKNAIGIADPALEVMYQFFPSWLWLD